LQQIKQRKTFSNDPLSKDNENYLNWVNIFEENDLKKLLQLDVCRTNQQYDLFQNKKLQQMMVNILFIWAKDNKNISYKQGMNEILGFLIIIFYPYYIQNECNELCEINAIYKGMSNHRKIYLYLFNENHFEADMFSLFANLMQRGLSEMFISANKEVLQINEKLSKYKFELFHLRWNGELEKYKKEKEEQQLMQVIDKLPLQKRIYKIFNILLPQIDQELYDSFKERDADPTLFLQRWIKCVFLREISFSNEVSVWDAIFAYDSRLTIRRMNYKPYLVLIDHICIALIIKIRNEILFKDATTVYHKCLNYPNIFDISSIIQMSLKSIDIIKQIENEKIIELSQKISKNSKKNKNSFQASVSDEQISESTSVLSNSTTSKTAKTQDIIKLEQIYLKYKDVFSLKDSREFLVILHNLKECK